MSFQNVRASDPILTFHWSINYFEVLMRNLPRHYPHNNVYTLFPFCTPSAAVDCLKQNPQLQIPGDIDLSDYDCDAPKQPIVHTLTTRAAISHVLNAFETYNTPYGEHYKKITDGYGYVAVTFQGSPPRLITVIVTFLALTMRLCSLLTEFFSKYSPCLWQPWPRPDNGDFICLSLVSCFLILNKKISEFTCAYPRFWGHITSVCDHNE